MFLILNRLMMFNLLNLFLNIYLKVLKDEIF